MHRFRAWLRRLEEWALAHDFINPLPPAGPLPHNEQIAFDLGVEEYCSSKSENPYRPGTPLHQRWLEGRGHGVREASFW